MRDIVELSPETAAEIQGECAPGDTVQLTMTCEVTQNDEGGFSATPTGDIDVEPVEDDEEEMDEGMMEEEEPMKGKKMPETVVAMVVGKGKKA